MNIISKNSFFSYKKEKQKELKTEIGEIFGVNGEEYIVYFYCCEKYKDEELYYRKVQEFFHPALPEKYRQDVEEFIQAKYNFNA